MIKKYIIVAGLVNNITIVGGDREVDQGPEVLVVVDRHLDELTVFKILKQKYPKIVLISSGVISILGDKVIRILVGPTSDITIMNNHTYNNQVAVVVNTYSCSYSKNITRSNTPISTHPIGSLNIVMDLVLKSFISE